MKEKMPIVNNTVIISGKIAIKAVLNLKKRKIKKIIFYNHKYDKDLNYILYLAKMEKIEIIKINKEDKDNYPMQNNKIIAYCEVRSFDQFDYKADFGAILVGIEDPYNLGQCMRSLYAFGCKNVLIDKTNFNLYDATVLKSSAGASEYLNLVLIDEKTLENLKNEYQIVALNRKDAIDIKDYQFDNRSIIVIGGEKRGISSLIQAYVDDNVYISYGEDFKNALGAVSACSISAYCYLRNYENNL